MAACLCLFVNFIRSGNLIRIVHSFVDKFDPKKDAHSTRIIEFVEAILESYEGNFEVRISYHSNNNNNNSR